MAEIDKLAHVSRSAYLGERVYIGPFCCVGPKAVIGDDCKLLASVHIKGQTELGARTLVHPFAVLGGDPQAITYRGEDTRLIVGSDCTIREYVTMNIGTLLGGGVTRVGDHGYFMASSHVAHDCAVGRDVIFANGATLAGHCVVGDGAFISGLVAVHQFSRIGKGAMVAGGSIVRGDVIPYGLAAGPLARLIGINVVGMKRKNVPVVSIRAARIAYRILFLASGSLEDRINATEKRIGTDPIVNEIIAFLRERGRRPLCQARRLTEGDTSVEA